MPVSKRRKKDETKKRRTRDAPAAAPASGPAPEPAPSSGLLSRMRGGFKNVAGTGPKKPESALSKIVTWAIVLVAAYFVAKKFGWIP
jgi:ribosomal protein S12